MFSCWKNPSPTGFLSILTASLRSSVPAAPCFWFLFSIIPLSYVSASPAHRSSVQQPKLWANGHPCVLKSEGSKKKKLLYANYPLLQNGVSVQNGITQANFRPTEITISFHSFHSKGSLCFCGQKQLQSYLLHPSLDAKCNGSGLPPECLFLVRPFNITH